MKSLRHTLTGAALALFGSPALAECDLFQTFENFYSMDDLQQAQTIEDCTASGTDWSQSFSFYPDNAPALYHASSNGMQGAFNALLEAGADPNGRNSEGETPLFALAFHARNRNQSLAFPGIADLIAAGADPKLQDDDGLTVLHMAVISSSPEVMAALLDSGIPPDYPHENGQPALYWLGGDDCDPEVGLVLIEYGARLRGIDPSSYDNYLAGLEAECSRNPHYPTLRAALLDIMDRS